MSTLRTDFSGAFDTGLFTRVQLGGPVTQTGGEIVFNVDTADDDTSVTDVSYADMTGDNFVIQLSSWPADNSNRKFQFGVFDAAGKGVGFSVASNGPFGASVVASSGSNRCLAVRSNVAASLGTYDKTVHVYLRLALSGTTASYDYSTDGVSFTTLTTQTVPSGFDGTAARATFGVGSTDDFTSWSVTNYWAPALTVAARRRPALLTTRRERKATVSRIVTRTWAGPPVIPSIPIGPTPDASTSGFSRRRTAAFARKNADFVNRRA